MPSFPSLPPDLSVRDALAAAMRAGLPALEARMLLTHVTGLTRTQLITRDGDMLDAHANDAFSALLARRLAGEPMAHLVGHREFFGRAFIVTPDVLIPRPDTEVAVEAALARLAGKTAPRVLDLGTGSGILAVTIACERPDAQVWATDISAAALTVARRNADALGAPHVRLLQSDWYDAVPANQSFDLIVSNPPYIAAGDPHLGQGDLRFEPLDALTDHGNGLGDVAAIVSGAGERLEENGWLLVEHGYDQGEAARALFGAAGLAEVITLRDLGGNERCTAGRWSAIRAGGA